MFNLIGKTIQHYEILEQIGRGGMGIVYKARDTRLLRQVAIKILPSHLVTDEKNRQRFIHEAQAASALNHPNICTIHDIGEFDSMHYIVMEYIPGQTLREIIQTRGALPEKEVVEICLQICSALEATHAKGIIHRDVKPDNIMISETGQVKIMDFGLAKLAAETSVPASKKTFPKAPTSYAHFKTSASTFEGTAPYLAPEQIEKAQVDERTDIYALGVVLYELLIGTPPFQAPTGLKLMKAILRDEPAAPSQMRQGLSETVDRLVLKALAKPPEMRYQTVAEMCHELSKITASPAKIFRQKTILMLTAFTTALMIFVFVMRLFFAGETNERKPPRLKFQKLSQTVGSEAWPVFSPDGRRIAYVSKKSISGTHTLNVQITAVESGQTKVIYERSEIDSKPKVAGLAWSPDGRWLAAHETKGGIWLIDVNGRNISKILTDFGYTPDWSPDGRKIAFSSQSPVLIWEDNEIWVYDFADSSMQKVSPENLLSYDSPTWSPDGRWLACLGGVGSEKALWLLNMETGEAKKFLYLQAGISHPNWSATGKYLYFKSQVNEIAGLYRVQVNLQTAELVAGPDLILSKIGHFDISLDGKKLVYRRQELPPDPYELWRLPLDMEEPWQKAELVKAYPFLIGNLAVAPDGKTLALEALRGRGRSILLFDLERRDQKTLYDKQAAYAPSWSADGRWIAFDAGGGNNADIWRVPASGGKAQKIVASAGADWMPTYSPDGDHICFLSNRSNRFDLWLSSTVTGEMRQITNTPATESGGYWSHDGKRLAYFRNALTGDSSGVWLYDLVQETEYQVFRFSDRKLDILTKIIWHPDDSAIYFHDERGFAKLHLTSKQLSHPLGIEPNPLTYFKYDLHQNQLYVVKVPAGPESLWLAEGLE